MNSNFPGYPAFVKCAFRNCRKRTSTVYPLNVGNCLTISHLPSEKCGHTVFPHRCSPLSAEVNCARPAKGCLRWPCQEERRVPGYGGGGLGTRPAGRDTAFRRTYVHIAVAEYGAVRALHPKSLCWFPGGYPALRLRHYHSTATSTNRTTRANHVG